MSALLAFDTHTYVKRLVSAGMPEPQAEVIADEQRNLITNELATKSDLKELEAGLKRDMKELEAATKRDLKELETGLKRDMKEMETRLTHDMKELEAATKRDIAEVKRDIAEVKRDIRESEQRTIIKLGSMMVVAVGVVAALVKLL